MKNNFKINIGDRIKYLNEIYEICYTDSEEIRYSNFISGKMYFINKSDLINKIINGDMELTSIYLPDKNKNQILEIHEINKYLEYIFQNKIPCSTKKLKLAIEIIIERNPSLKKISASTLARYIKKFKEGSNTYSKFNHTSNGNKSLRFSLEIEQIITDVIFQIIIKKESFNPSDAYLMIKEKIIALNCNAKIPSLRTIYRRFNRLDPYLVTKYKKGSREAKKNFHASGQSINSPNLLTIIEIDTHMIDCILIDKYGNTLGRPYLSAAIDIYTRAIIGWQLCMLPPSATKTLLTLKDMLLRPHRGLMGGIPTIIIPDNGCEFNNNALANFCNNFNITKSESQPYEPNNKPHIEGFFKTLNQNFIHKLKGTTYSSPKERGDYDSVKNACYTIENLRDLLNEWIENIYHKSIHSGTNQRPEKMWNEASKIFPNFIIPKIEIEKKCRSVFQYKIHKGQINLKGLRYKSHALSTLHNHFKEKVTIYVNTLDLSSIYIQDPYDSNNLIQADSIFPEATQNLSLAEWIEAKTILREKYKVDPDEIKNEELLFLARINFLHTIETLNKRNKRFRQIKNDLPQLIKHAEDKLNLTVESDQKEEINNITNDSFETDMTSSFSPALLANFFYEEVNFDD